MADSLTFSPESVLKFLLSNNGKVTNHELVKHFKEFLTGPNSQQSKLIFKEYVNSVATMKVEDGVKYVIVRKRSRNDKTDTSSSDGMDDSSSSIDVKKCRLNEDDPPQPHVGILHSHSSPSVLGLVPNENSSDSRATTPGVQSPSVFWSSDLPPGHVPQPPPRRKHSLKGKENTGAKFEESIRQINEEKEATSPSRNEEIQEIVSPGSVKEKAHFLNKMASEQDPPQKPTASVRRRDNHYKGGDDDDAISVSSLDPRRKKWILASSRADYHELVRLLREEPKLAYVKVMQFFCPTLYTFSELSAPVQAWIPTLLKMKKAVKTDSNSTFKNAPLNYYRCGRVRIEVHNDDETYLVLTFPVATASLDATLTMYFTRENHETVKRPLEN